jgi:hypothetical protein
MLQRYTQSRNSPVPAWIVSTCLVACLLPTQLRAAAPDNPRKFAITDRNKVDPDFHVQGEYAGTTEYGYFGLQVVALGDGGFQATLYVGGLPGGGWNREDRHELKALPSQGEGKVPVLKGEEYLVELEPMVAMLSMTSGVSVGNLAKVDRWSSTLGARPPTGADVLFDSGGDLSRFEKNAKLNDEGLLHVGALLKDAVHDFRLHLEFRTPYMPYARGQSRGNSGVYIQRRYEVQVLDSFGLKGEPNECGGLYRQKSPDLNMCLPPLSWQTYDIYFTAARFDANGEKRLPSTITVRHNGVTIHDRYPLKNKTGAGRPEGPDPLPILLQDHGNPVAFQNIWIADSDCNHGEAVQAAPKPTRKKRRRLLRRRG